MAVREMSKYAKVIEYAFNKNYEDGQIFVPFTRDDLVEAHTVLKLSRTKNIGDIPYSFRFRKALPESVIAKAPEGSEWIIEGIGDATYRFRLASPGKIVPNPHVHKIKIPDATPEIVKKYAPGTDEQALLTKVRYNRLLDIFTGLTCYSIQNHLRTNVAGIGQIEIDEIYCALSKNGSHYVIPCQAKSVGDSFGVVQAMQDIALCQERYPHAICRPISMQFLTENEVAILEFTVLENEHQVIEFRVIEEKHYRLVPQNSLTNEDISAYNEREYS